MELTNVNDYVEKVHEKFPELSQEEVKRILVYGFKMIVQYTSAGNDISLSTNKGFLFIGQIPSSAFAAFKKYCYKLSKRIAYMFQRTREQWDGYYYFSRSERQFQEYLKQSKKQYKIFDNVQLYKLLEELKVKEHSSPYIFRLSEDKTGWTKKFYKQIRTKKAELIIVRDALNMKDVMTSYNKFKYIQ